MSTQVAAAPFSAQEVLQGPSYFLVSQPPPLCSFVWSSCLDDRRHPHPPLIHSGIVLRVMGVDLMGLVGG